MKLFTLIFCLFSFSLAHSEVWKKPIYSPDENHLPEMEIEKQEAPLTEEEALKQRQEDKEYMDDYLEESEERENAE